MQEIIDVTQTLSGTRLEILLALIVLAAFGLAAFAIYAVLTATGGRK